MKLTPIISCEHAGNAIPAAYSHLFNDADDVLHSHRGWDPGALEIALFISGQLNAPLFKCEATRLLVEPNRSLFHTSLFSEYSQGLTEEEREEVLRQFYYPHRSGVESWIKDSSREILHLSMHTFTPIFDGVTRTVDIGLLFDPDRSKETEFCSLYRQELEKELPLFSMEFNEPYKGVDDGFTTYLRTQFRDEDYLGIEIEVNQKYIATPQGSTIATALAEVLKRIIN